MSAEKPKNTSESVLLHPLDTAAAPEPELLCIFGTGDLGRSLGQRLLQSGYRVVYGSRRPTSCGPLPQGTQVMSHAAAAQSASVVFVCVHRENYEFLETLAPQLRGKVLVDVSNNLKKNLYPEANAEYLQRLIPGAQVVKAFNTLSAWALQNGPSDANRQLYRGTKYKRFPDWLDRWMLCRKQLGLVALGLAFLHVLYTLIIPIRYYVKFRIAASTVLQMKENQTKEFNTVWAWQGDSFYSTGILGFGMFLLLGITSLPSVTNALSWREFNFIQSKLGYLTVFLCTFHTYLYGWNKFLRPSSYKWNTPPAFMLSLVLPTVVMVLKLLLLLPCVDRRLTRIRQGWERTDPKDDSRKSLLA
uniref:STEAP family member 4 n=1 Tax=Scophthalmus maximus TaxID=52904 RepID=A0A8D3DM13_SCOMX